MSVSSLARRVYRFLLTPRWLVASLLALAVTTIFLGLGRWQLSRRAEDLAARTELEARMAMPPLTLKEVGDPAEAVNRVLEVSGTYDPSRQLALGLRSRNEIQGQEVLTPLRMADGSAVLVNRGWVTTGTPLPLPPAGEVAVSGYIRQGEAPGGLGPNNPGSGTLTVAYRMDLGRLGQQLPYPLLPFYIALQTQDPSPVASDPVPLPAPAGGRRPPHLAYAIQWFAFAAIVAVGYPLLVRASRRHSI